MRRILWTLAPVTLGAALALCAASAEAAPTPMQLPELVLPMPSHHSHKSAEMDKSKNGQVRDLGDYNLPGERTGDTTSSRLDASGGFLL
jgi:hypothetical protein